MAIIIKNNEVNIFSNAHDLFQFSAKDFMQRALAAIQDKGIFSVVLSGGTTPTLFFDTLTSVENYRSNIPWQKIQFFFGDERYVPSENAESNYHMAYQHLFSKVSVDPKNIYRIPTEFDDPKDAAKDYEKTLRKIFHIKDDAFPSFDLVYLGLGNDAHTASLMPCSDPISDHVENSLSNQLVASLFVPQLQMYRITLTPNAINHAKNIIFLVTGENKATAVWEVLEGSTDYLHYPAQLIQSRQGKTMWYLDQSAAKDINNDD